jgi:hypothetical protein
MATAASVSAAACCCCCFPAESFLENQCIINSTNVSEGADLYDLGKVTLTNTAAAAAVPQVHF